MFLLEPGHTAWDLKWRMFGVPVRVHPMFWLVGAIMGFGTLQSSFAVFLVWMGCLFFSILIHELGHVFMFRLCGTTAHVVLYAFGGLAVPHHVLYNRRKRIAVSFAGPAAGFLVVAGIAIFLALTDIEDFRAVIEFVMRLFGRRPNQPIIMDVHPLVENAILDLVWINLFWGLLNLVPIYPLDGGHISRDFLDGAMPGGQGIRVSLGISLVLAGLLTVHCIASENGHHLIPFLPSLGIYECFDVRPSLAPQSFQMLQQESNPPWRRYD